MNYVCTLMFGLGFNLYLFYFFQPNYVFMGFSPQATLKKQVKTKKLNLMFFQSFKIQLKATFLFRLFVM